MKKIKAEENVMMLSLDECMYLICLLTNSISF